MAISSVTSKVIYVGDAATATLAYPFRILAEGDLTVSRYVTLTSVASVLTLTTDYTVTDVGVAGGGNVLLTGSYASGMPTGSNTIIRRVVDLTQTTDYVENDPFPADTHENALDKLTLASQQLQEQIDRAILGDINQTSASYSDFAGAASKATSSATVSVTSAAEAAASAVLASQSAASASTGSLQVSFDADDAIVIADNDNQTLSVTNNDVTNDPVTVLISSAANSVGLQIDYTGSTDAGIGLLINSLGSGTAMNITGRQGTRHTHLLRIQQSSLGSSPMVQIYQAGNSSVAPGLQICQSGNANGIYVNCDTSGGRPITAVSAYGNILKLTHNGSRSGIDLELAAALGANQHGMYIHSNAVQTSVPLVKIVQDHASATEPSLEIDHDGENAALEISSSNSSAAHIRLTGDSANATPTDGDIWFDGTSLKIRIGSVTAVLTTE